MYLINQEIYFIYFNQEMYFINQEIY